MTFGETWRKVALQASAVPPLLCRQYVLDAFKEACDGRQWGFLRVETQFQTLAAREVTVTVTQDSDAITSSTADFLATDVGRQIRISGAPNPFYTIAAVASASAATLDQPYAQASATDATASIVNAYLTLPEDFGGFRLLRNPAVNRFMPWWYTDEWLNVVDAMRFQTDSTARLVASRTVTSAGRAQYEWWPTPTGAYAYPCSYYRRPQDFPDDAQLPGILATRSHLLETGALAACALYPGTPAQRNPYFNLPLADRLQRRWLEGLQALAVRDDDQFAQMLEPVDYRWALGGLVSDHYLRSSDAPASATYGHWGGPY